MSRWLDDDESRGRAGGASGVGKIALRVAAIVPVPADLGGAGDVLAVAAFGSARLPMGELAAGESLFAAARRVVWQTAGAGATPERLVYLLERGGRELTFCVLCALEDADDAPEKAGVRFISPAAAEEFDPPALRDLLLEDGRQGFVRPVAHIMLIATESGREETRINW